MSKVPQALAATEQDIQQVITAPLLLLLYSYSNYCTTTLLHYSTLILITAPLLLLITAPLLYCTTTLLLF